MSPETQQKALELAVAIIKRWEGCKLSAYRCPAGVWTIGWGETRGVKRGDVWTQSKADAELEERVQEFMEGVVAAVPGLHEETPQRIAACVSLAYNIGIGAFKTSSVARYTQAKEYTLAANAFSRWSLSKGVKLAGLEARRREESLLYQGSIV